MGTEERTEGSELEPTGIELSPLLLICILLACAVVKLLTSYISVLNTETSDVHCPIWDTADREVKTCRDLSLHILPTSSDVTAPCCCRVSLETCKSASCKKEHALVRIHITLTVVDCVSIHNRICIEVFCRRTECCRAAKSLSVIHISTVTYIRL